MPLEANEYGRRWAWANSLPCPALIFRLSDGSVVCANGAFARLLGMPAPQVEGQPAASLIPELFDRQQATGTPETGPGVPVEVNAGGTTVALNAHIGPADDTAEHMLVTLLPREGRGSAADVESAMLRETLGEYVRERDVIASVGRIASSPIDFASALAGFAAEFNRILPVTDVAIHQFNSTSGMLSPGHRWSAEDAEPHRGCDSDIDADAARARCVTELQPIVVPCSCRGGDSIAAAVVAPLLLGNSLIGTLTISAQGMKLPDTRTVSLVARLADEIAGAVHTARTYQEKQRETEMRRTLAAVGLAASRDLELERVLERVANEIAELMRYDLMVVALADPDRTALRVRYQVGAEVRFSGYETAAEGQGRLLLPPRRRSITSLESYPEFAELGEAGFKSLLEVSFGMHEAATLGYMALVAKDEAAFSRQNLELMKHLAAHVSPAVQNALAHEQSVALAEARTAEAKAEARSLELERINQAKSQFLGVVSHELRTPLTSISAYSELLQRNAEGNLNERQVRQATVISESARHLKFLISDLLDVSRIESGNFSLEIARFGLRSLVDEVAERLRPVLVEKSQELDLHVARGRLEVDGDRRRIAQVISNIIENASKYSPAGTAITLDVHRRRDEILVSVRDRGIGISAEDQQQLFTPFFRANSGLTRTEPGTGLGLSLVKKISELHGGTVSVKSRPGEGSTFTVTLHAAKMAQAA